MIYKSLFIFYVLANVLLLAKEKTVFSIALPHFPPYFYTDSSGKIVGKAIEKANRILDAIGYGYQYEIYPGKRVFNLLKAKSTDMSFLIKNEGIMDHVVYSKHTLFKDEIRMYSIHNLPPVTEKEKFRGEYIILMRGWWYGGLGPFIRDPKNGVFPLEVNSFESGLKMLERQRGEYLLGYKGPTGDAQEKVRVKNLESAFIKPLDVYFLIHKDHPERDRFLKKLDAWFQEHPES